VESNQGFFLTEVRGVGRNFRKAASLTVSLFIFYSVDFAVSRTDGAFFEPSKGLFDFFWEEILGMGLKVNRLELVLRHRRKIISAECLKKKGLTKKFLFIQSLSKKNIIRLSFPLSFVIPAQLGVQSPPFVIPAQAGIQRYNEF